MKSLAILCGCTARFVWDLVGNPEDRFSHNEAHFIMGWHVCFPGSTTKEEREERTGSETEVHDPTSGQGGAINELPSDVIDEPPNDAINEPPNDAIDEPPTDVINELPTDVIDEASNDAIHEHSYDTTVEHFDAIDKLPNDAIDEPLNDESRSSEIPPWLRGYQTNFMPNSSFHK